jgi:hypothetical protein
MVRGELIAFAQVWFELHPMGSHLALDPDELGGVPGWLPGRGHDDADGLAGVVDRGVLKWHEGLARSALAGHDRLQTRQAGSVQVLITPSTPGAASAADVSSRAIRPRAIVLRTKAAWVMPSIRCSAAGDPWHGWTIGAGTDSMPVSSGYRTV